MKSVSCIFFHVKLDDINKAIKYIVETIKGTRDFHSIKSIGAKDVNKLMKKGLSWFCCFCVDGNFITCENLPWIEEWEAYCTSAHGGNNLMQATL